MLKKEYNASIQKTKIDSFERHMPFGGMIYRIETVNRSQNDKRNDAARKFTSENEAE